MHAIKLLSASGFDLVRGKDIKVLGILKYANKRSALDQQSVKTAVANIDIIMTWIPMHCMYPPYM